MGRKNMIEKRGYSKEVLQMAALGMSQEEIADKLTEWDAGKPDPIEFSRGSVQNFLEVRLQGGTSKALEIQRNRDALDLINLVKNNISLFTRELDLANRTVPLDARRLKYASENLVSWWDRSAELLGMTGKGGGNVNININAGSADKEMDALKQAILEEMADYPELWPKILARAKAIVDGAHVPTGGVVAADFKVSAAKDSSSSDSPST